MGSMSTFEMPWTHSMDNPTYRAKVAEFNRINAEFDGRFRSALAGAVENERGMSARFLDERGPFAQLPWLSWDDDPLGGYWIGSGLQHYPEMPAAVWPTFIFASYLRDSEDGESHSRNERALDIKLTDDSARDVDLLAMMTISALRIHRRTL